MRKTYKISAVITGGKIHKPWESPDSPLTTGFGISNFEEKNQFKISENLLKKSQTSDLKNYKDLSSHNWRKDSQHLRVL